MDDLAYEAGVNDALLHANELQRDQTKLLDFAGTALRELLRCDVTLEQIHSFVAGYNDYVRASDERTERTRQVQYITVTPHPHEGYRLVEQQSLATADKYNIPYKIWDYQWLELVRREYDEGFEFVINECVMSPKIGYGY